MRIDIKNKYGTKPKVEAVSEVLEPLGYEIDARNTTNKEYWFKNNLFHLRLVPWKTRVNVILHKDNLLVEKHFGMTTKGTEIKDEMKKIRKSLESILII